MNAIKRYKYVDIIRNIGLIPKNYSIRFQVVLITKKCSDFVLYICFSDTFKEWLRLPNLNHIFRNAKTIEECRRTKDKTTIGGS